MIIWNDHLGDLVLSTHLFKEIKKKLPNSEISIVVSRLNKPLIEKDKSIDSIIELGIPKYSLKTIWNFLKMSFWIRKKKFDIGIDLRGSLMNAGFLLYLSGIKERISRSDFHRGISFFLTKPINPSFQDHIIKENLEIINQGLNIHSHNYWPEILTDKGDEKEVKEFLKKKKVKKYVCICPIAGSKARQWQLSNFKRLIKDLGKRQLDILVMGVSKDKHQLEELAKANKRCKIVLNFNLRQMSILFKKSIFVLAQDGGPMHIAWVSGARLLALFPRFPEGMKKIVPLKNSIVFVTKNKTMDSIQFEEVESAVYNILKNAHI